MKKFPLAVVFAALLSAGAMSGCKLGGGGVISIWVGDESVAFYRDACKKFLAENPDFTYPLQVNGTSTGTNAAALINDNTACADIVTVAHDNIGKLSQGNYIKPILDEELLAQIKADNSPEYITAVTNYLGNAKTLEDEAEREKWHMIFGSPYISQALVLYYNKAYVSAEQAQTFEGLREAAAAASTSNQKVKSYTVTGMDGYNYSFNLLARKMPENETTLRLYEDGELRNCFAQGEDELASLQWACRSFNDENGGQLPGSSAWNVLMTADEGKAPKVLSAISGAWNYNTFVKAVGEENAGIAKLPTYTLTAEDCAGVDTDEIPVGTVMQAGSFADCKAFVINMASDGDKYKPIQKLIKYLSSKPVQDESFAAAGNVPAYTGAMQSITKLHDEGKVNDGLYQLAGAQSAMVEYGMPQPFFDGTLNAFYYQKSADALYKNAIINDIQANRGEDYSDTPARREVLYRMQRIWMTSLDPGYHNQKYYPDGYPVL